MNNVPNILAEKRAKRLAWLLIAVLFGWFVGPTLLTRGMFMDGVAYATVSRNMAVGIGDFWHPIYTEGRAGGFHDHPPLALGLQATLFALFGDSYWVERLYSALTAPCLIAMIALLWRARQGSLNSSISGWLPVLMWMTIPSWSWMYKNNIMENTLAPLAALSVYASLRLHQAGNLRTAWCWAALSAFAMLGAALTKGPVGLFPAITPLVAGLCFRDQSWKAVLRNQLALLTLFGIFVGSLSLYGPAREFFGAYFREQIVASLSGKRGALHGRLYLIERTITALGPPLGIAILMHFLGKRTTPAGHPQETGERRSAWFFLLTALSASVPLLASPRQAGMYAAPSYPYYVLALAVIAAPGIQRLMARISSWLAVDWNYGKSCAGLGTLLVLAGVVTISRYGTIARDADLLRDVAKVGDRVPPRSIVSWPADLPIDWRLEAYLYRLHYISLSPANSLATPYSIEPRTAKVPAQDEPRNTNRVAPVSIVRARSPRTSVPLGGRLP